MSFTCDKQTLDDLNILGKYKPDSIYSLFGGVHTSGGEQLLDSLFRHPLTDPAEINRRSALFRYFQDSVTAFPLDKEPLSVMENYLSTGGRGHWLGSVLQTGWKKLTNSILRDETYSVIQDGLLSTIRILNSFGGFMGRLDADGPYGEQVRKVGALLDDRRLEWIKEQRRFSWFNVARYDHLLRNVLQQEMKTLTDIIYHVDVCVAVGLVARAKGFSYAHAQPKDRNMFRTTGLRHPCLEKAVANPLSLWGDNNMLFLTGANMAGKSTFMKAFGLSVYLAHMGFPVAAEEMTFSVRDGIYSSINVPDNLSLGYSHFYAEVLRVKKVAEEVSGGKDLIVIFDELFKGTNVKDAYDGTLAVSAAFSEYRNCMFILSTHIIEVGEALRVGRPNLQVAYLPTFMEGAVPRYTYRMQEGITSDRHGMMIIENEKIIDIILSEGKVSN